MIVNKDIRANENFVKSTLHTAADTNIGTYYLADNPRYFEPQRTNSFEFYVQDLNKQLDNIPNNSWAWMNAEEILRLSVKSSSVPHFTTAPITINRGNSQMHFAGKSQFGDGEFVVHDYIGAGTKDMLLAWQRQVYDPNTDKTGLASDYKKDAYLLEYTPEHQLVRTWKLYGCWITEISEENYDHEDAKDKMLTVKFKYDRAKLDFSDQQPGM